MRVLVVGGAGYIGSHMVKLLAEHGHEPVVFDNFSTGHRAAVRWGRSHEASVGDPVALDHVFRNAKFDAVMHFAANSIVAESVANPLKYYINNVCHTLQLLQAMKRHGVNRFIFSSTAAVFGEPQTAIIDETHPTSPINPYGDTKLVVENALRDCARASGLHAVSLRYFNAAGADPSGLIGEAHEPETHLIPKLLRSALGQDHCISINGDDYDTDDGTCVRDFVHVNDIARAHLKALECLDFLPGFQAFNLGNGRGYSVRQVVEAAEEVVGRRLNIPVAARRPGDPQRLVASKARAQEVLGWAPLTTDMREIIESAWRWHRAPAF